MIGINDPYLLYRVALLSLNVGSFCKPYFFTLNKMQTYLRLMRSFEVFNSVKTWIVPLESR